MHKVGCLGRHFIQLYDLATGTTYVFQIYATDSLDEYNYNLVLVKYSQPDEGDDDGGEHAYAFERA